MPAGKKTMMRLIAVSMFVLVVMVCLYVLLNPGSYSTPVLCLAGFVSCIAACAVAPVWKIYLSIKPQKRRLGGGNRPACSVIVAFNSRLKKRYVRLLLDELFASIGL